ncbi:MAG: 30S ribosomal protein S21 [Vulcanimicrobiota bacterium]
MQSSQGKGEFLEIQIEQGEPLEKALRRFRRQCQRDGILAEIKRRAYYEKPSEKRKRAIERAKRRAARRN